MDVTALRDIRTKLARYGLARDRTIEREPRTITITDDEALVILDALTSTHTHVPYLTKTGAFCTICDRPMKVER